MVCAGAGGHGGTLSPFALVPELRQIFDGTILLGGAISTGAQVSAARAVGADLAYVGPRFVATQEALVSEAQKRMVVEARAADILYTPNISGVNANIMRPSLVAQGLDPDASPPAHALDMDNETKAWKTLWSAGQGVGSIIDVPPAAELCQRLAREYHAAVSALAEESFVRGKGDAA